MGACGVKAASLLKLSTLGLSSEQMAAVLAVLAEELAPLDAMRTSAAQRQAKHRLSRYNNVTDGRDNDVTPRVRVKDINISSQEVNKISPPIPPVNERFEQFKAAYPRRDKNMDWRAAEKALNAALRRTDFDTIMAACKDYAADMQRKGKVGTEFVRQPRTWLNADPWKEMAAQPASTPTVAHTVVIEGTPAWDALKAKNPRLTARDIRTPSGIVRGTYHYGEAA